MSETRRKYFKSAAGRVQPPRRLVDSIAAANLGANPKADSTISVDVCVRIDFDALTRFSREQLTALMCGIGQIIAAREGGRAR